MSIDFFFFFYFLVSIIITLVHRYIFIFDSLYPYNLNNILHNSFEIVIFLMVSKIFSNSSTNETMSNQCSLSNWQILRSPKISNWRILAKRPKIIINLRIFTDRQKWVKNSIRFLARQKKSAFGVSSALFYFESGNRKFGAVSFRGQECYRF